MKYIYSNAKLKMEYLKFGNGPKTMVILPGLNLYSNCALPSVSEKTLTPYTEGYTCYLFDRAMDLKKDTTVASIVEDTAMVIKELRLHDIYLFGASFGGMIAQEMTIRHPELVKKLFLTSTISRNNEVSNKTFRNWIELSLNNRKDELIYSMVHAIFSDKVLNKSEKGLLAYFDSVSEERLQRFAIETASILSFDVYDRLLQIQCPIMVAGCENDKVLSSVGVKEIHEKTKAPIILYGNEYSHNVYDEAPDFKSKVLEFFNQNTK